MATLVVNTLRNITGTDNTGAAISGDFVSVARNFNNAKVPATELRDAVEVFATAKLAEKDTRIAELQADKDKLQTLVNSMGGTAEGLRLAKLARRQAALDAQAAAEAELAAIDAEP